MKLSVEEKAKRYDEAYKKVAVRFGSNIADEIFLKESEDEKTRKEIIDFATKANNSVTSILANNYNFNKWLNWLEKQGENQNNVYDEELSEILGRVIRRYINDPSIPYTKREKVSMEIIPYVERLEKQGEQKPKKCMYSDDNYTDEERKVLCDGCEEECELRQKPAWSEEDENTLNAILTCYKSMDIKWRTWLKSLKDRVQPKQEWSECDEIDIQAAIEICENAGYELIANRLKSLKPQNKWISIDKEVYVKEPILVQKKDKSDQFGGFVVCCDHTLTPNVYERYMILGNIVSQNTWKPSDEQMKALDKVIRNPYLSTAEYNGLVALREQLKAL